MAAYDTLYTDGMDLHNIGTAFEAEGGARLSTVGDAMARFTRQRELVDFAVKWIEKNRK